MWISVDNAVYDERKYHHAIKLMLICFENGSSIHLQSVITSLILHILLYVFFLNRLQYEHIHVLLCNVFNPCISS